MRSRLLYLAAVLLLGGCASSPKADIVETADTECRTISDRFTGDLDERVKLVTGLRDKIKAMPAPESGQRELDEWLRTLETFAGEMTKFKNMQANAPRGADMLVVTQSALVDNAMQKIAPAAKAFGFAACSDTAKWTLYPPT